jgi:tagatose 1,6-diphosphate aldolase
MGVAPADVPPENLSQFKEAVSTILTPHASAILLDPEYGLPAAAKRAANAGLLLAYEQTGYDKNMPGRMPRLLDGWSVKRLIEAGANAVKLLLYYSSRSSVETNDLKYAFVEKVGAECAASDVPFFLELVSYGENMDEKSIEFARIKHEVVAAGMKEFSKPRYHVDVLKVGMPVNLSLSRDRRPRPEKFFTSESRPAIFLLAAGARRFRLFTFPRALATPPFSLDCNSLPKPVPNSQEFFAEGPRGKMASEFL